MRMLTLKPGATCFLTYAPEGRLLHSPGDLLALGEGKHGDEEQYLFCVQTPGTPWQSLSSLQEERLLLDDWLWRLAAQTYSIKLRSAPGWSAPNLRVFNSFSNLIFTSDFRTLIYQSRDELLQISLPGGSLFSSSDGFGYFTPVLLALSPDDRWLAGLEDGTLIVCRDLKRGNVTRALPHDSQRVVALAFTADGRQLVSATQHAVYLWDVAQQQQTKCFEVGGSKLVDMAIQPAGPVLVTAHADHTVTLRERASGRILRSFDWKIGPLRGVAFAPDGQTAAALGKNGQLFVWDVDPD